MKTIFFNSIGSTAGAPREFFAPAFLKRRFPSRPRATNIGTPHKQDLWVQVMAKIIF